MRYREPRTQDLVRAGRVYISQARRASPRLPSFMPMVSVVSRRGSPDRQDDALGGRVPAAVHAASATKDGQRHRTSGPWRAHASRSQAGAPIADDRVGGVCTSGGERPAALSRCCDQAPVRTPEGSLSPSGLDGPLRRSSVARPQGPARNTATGTYPATQAEGCRAKRVPLFVFTVRAS